MLEPSGFERRVRESFARQAMMATLGATLERVVPGEVDIRLPYRADLTQQHGFLHAGAITTIVDTACGYAALSVMAPGAAVLTVEFKVSLLAPGQGRSFLARGRVLKSGRTLVFTAGEVLADDEPALPASSGRTDRPARLIATMTATVMAVRDRPGLAD